VSGGKRFLGVIPLLPFLAIAFGFPSWLGYNYIFQFLIPPLAMAVGMIIYHFTRKKGPVPIPFPEPAQPQPVQTQQGVPAPVQGEETNLEPIHKEEPATETPVPCNSLTLVVQSGDLRNLKEQGAAFSSALSGQALYIQDRLVFQGMPIAVTHIEPDGPALVTSDTAVKIKGTEDPIILICPSCGEVQNKMQQTCDKCKRELPVIML